MGEFTDAELVKWAKAESEGSLSSAQLDVWHEIKISEGIAKREPFVPNAVDDTDPAAITQAALPQNTTLGEDIKAKVSAVATSPVDNLVKPVVGGLADIGSGMIRAGAGAKQVVGNAMLPPFIPPELMPEGVSRGDVTSALTDELVTKPELARQERFADARKGVTGQDPSLLTYVGEAVVPMKTPNRVTGLGRALQASAYGGLSGGLEFSEGGQSDRAINVLTGIAAGPVAQGGAELLQKAPFMFSQKARNAAALDSPSLNKKEVSDVLKAAEDLGIVITPAEASGDPLLMVGERSLNINQASRSELRDFMEDRHRLLLDDIESLKASAAVNQTGDDQTFVEFTEELIGIRSEIFSQTLDEDVFEEIMKSSPLLKSQFDAYKSALAKGAKGRLTNKEALAVERFNKLREDLGISDALPVNNVGFLDMMMGQLDDFVETTKGGASGDFAVTSAVRKKISDKLKETVPGYADYKMRSQRDLAIKYINETIDSIPDLATQKGATTKGFYSAVLSKPQTRKELIQLMGSIPGAEKKINDLHKVMGSIFGNDSMQKAINQRLPDLLAEGGTAGAGVLGAMLIRGKKFFTGEFDIAMMEYITNPNWTQDISKFVAVKDRMRTASNLAAYFTRVANVRGDIDSKFTEMKDQADQTSEKALQAIPSAL
jgi:hypothetical protein